VDTLNALFRWLHILAGVIWIGMLYFFNWVNGPFAATLDAETKKKVVPELMPRALYWFRWGAAWTWVTGVLLLLLVFYHGGLTFEPGREWNAGGIVMVLVTFLAAAGYDALAPQRLHVGARRLDHGQPAHDHCSHRPRHPGAVLLRSAPGHHRGGVAHRLAALQDRPESEGFLNPNASQRVGVG